MKVRQGEINLYVSNLDAAATFYAEGLGFEVFEASDEEGYRKLQNGEVVLTLFLARQPGPAEPRAGRPSMSCDLHVDDIQETARRLAAAGARVSEIKDWPGGKHLLFSDPDGISWELLSP